MARLWEIARKTEMNILNEMFCVLINVRHDFHADQAAVG